MKFILLGNDLFSENLFKGFSEQGHECVLVISKPMDLIPVGHSGLRELAIKEGLNLLEEDNVNDKKFLQRLKQFDFDFTVSAWPSILGTEIINLSRLGTIGTHPSPLPLGRGRHPLHWLIYMGFTEFFLTFFQMNLKIDAGNLIHQEKFEIPKNSTIHMALTELNLAGYRGATEIGDKLNKSGFLESIPQSKIKSPFFRARTKHDLYIDFRSTAISIRNLVNSYSNPFNFAKIKLLNLELSIKTCEILQHSINDNYIPPGYVVKVEECTITIKSYDLLIKLTSNIDFSSQLRSGDFIHPPSYYFDIFSK